MSLAAVAAVFAGCQKPEFDVQVQEVVKDAFTASVENFEGQTKTVLDGNQVVWSTGDQLAIFQGSTVADKYVLADGAEGLTSGKFVYAGGNGTVNGDFFASSTELDRNVALYPYVEELELAVADDEERGATYSVAVTLPATQEYVQNSFANGAFPMIAVTDEAADHTLKFKNVLGAVKFQFTGTQAVQSISVKGNDGEPLAGSATVVAYADNHKPSVEFEVVAEDDFFDELYAVEPTYETVVTLDCGDGVQLSDQPTTFYMALPPTVFAEGFTVTIKTTDGGTANVVSALETEVKRSAILVMPELEVEGILPVTYDKVTVNAEPSMTDVEFTLTIDHNKVTGFYGMFVDKMMWDYGVRDMFATGYFPISMLLANQFAMDGVPCNEYKGTTYTGKLSEFGWAPEYLEWEMYNMIEAGFTYYAMIVPIFEGKTEYAFEDLMTFELSTATLSAGGNVALPAYEMEKGYNGTTVKFAASDEISFARWEIFPADATEDELPTEENFLDLITYDAYYDAEDGFYVDVDNDYGVLPGAKYKLYVLLADANGKANYHVIEVETLSIPYNDNLVVTIDEPEYDSLYNAVDAVVNVPAGAVKLYYTLNTQLEYEAYDAVSCLVGILQGTTGYDSMDVTKEGPVSLSFELGDLNAFGPYKVAIHVACVDAEGKISQWVSSAAVNAPQFPAPAN